MQLSCLSSSVDRISAYSTEGHGFESCVRQQLRGCSSLFCHSLVCCHEHVLYTYNACACPGKQASQSRGI